MSLINKFFSNCGDVEITLIEEILSDTLKVPFPLKGRNF